MIYVGINSENFVTGFYTEDRHGIDRCSKIINNGGIMIAPAVWNRINKWYKIKFIGIKNDANEYSIADFEEIKKIIEITPPTPNPIEVLEEKVEVLTVENSQLKNENIMQDELINITMLATDEMFTMLEPLLEQNATTFGAATFAAFGREEVSPMVDMYVAMVQRGLKTIDEVPVRYRAQVAEILAVLEG